MLNTNSYHPNEQEHFSLLSIAKPFGYNSATGHYHSARDVLWHCHKYTVSQLYYLCYGQRLLLLADDIWGTKYMEIG
jgi:hypothetical protein